MIHGDRDHLFATSQVVTFLNGLFGVAMSVLACASPMTLDYTGGPASRAITAFLGVGGLLNLIAMLFALFSREHFSRWVFWSGIAALTLSLAGCFGGGAALNALGIRDPV